MSKLLTGTVYTHTHTHLHTTRSVLLILLNGNIIAFQIYVIDSADRKRFEETGQVSLASSDVCVLCNVHILHTHRFILGSHVDVCVLGAG